MAVRTFRLGSFGVYSYEDTDLYPDGVAHGLYSDNPPTLGTEIARLDDIWEYTQLAAVANINNPAAELAGLSSISDGGLLIVYQAAAGANNEYTIYSWDSSGGAVNVPYVVAGNGGNWVAVAGKYVNSNIYRANLTLTGNLTMPDGGTIGNGVALTFDDTLNYLNLTGIDRFGIGTTIPEQFVHIYNSSDHALLRITSGNTKIAGVDLGDIDDTDRAWVRYDNNTDTFQLAGNAQLFLDYASNILRLRTAGSDAIRIDAAQNVLINTSTLVGKLTIHQPSLTFAKPVLSLYQADVSEEFIKFIGTSAADNSQSLVDAADLTTPGAIVGWIRVYIQDDAAMGAIPDGIYFVPFYSTPTA